LLPTPTSIFHTTLTFSIQTNIRQHKMPKRKTSVKKLPVPPPPRSSRPSPPFPGDQPLRSSNPYNAPLQPGEIGWEYDEEVEAPWALLGSLNLWNMRQMRRVMSMIDDPLHKKPKAAREAKWSPNRLHRWERAIVRRIMNETKGNYLLYKMLLWFGSYWNKTDKEVDHAINTLSEWASFEVRRRQLYTLDYKKTKEDWQAFTGSPWKDAEDLEHNTDLVELADRRDHDYEERLQKHLATFEHVYFPSETLEDDENYFTEKDAPGDISEPEEIKEEPIPEKVSN
jgi:hypothetical protein